jgi:branched-chain amino acid transport system ATP-binding protein
MSSFRALRLLDELFRGPAPVWIACFSEAITHLQRRGATILMTEQKARPAPGCMMRGGEVRRSGTIAEIRELARAEDYLQWTV